MKRIITILLFCVPLYITEQNKMYRNPETERLYELLKLLVENKQTMFGMANPTTIGYAAGPLNGDYNHSDCKDITGDHPAFHESDLMWYEVNQEFRSWDIKAMKKAWQRGAIIGYCWHIGGPLSHKFYATQDGRPSPDYHLATEMFEKDMKRIRKQNKL